MLFSQDIGIDLGTSNTLVFVKGKGIIIREPSVVAVDQRFTPVKVVAVGSEAKDMIGRTPGSIVALRPLRDGVIADFDATAEMLKKFIRKAITASPLSKTRVMICVPSGVTEVERRAVNDAAKSAGARYVSLIEEPMAAAIGVGLPVSEPSGSMIVDIGGGTTEVAVISLSGIVEAKSVRVGGDEMDQAIIQHMKRVYNLMIGVRTAEDIKIQIGSAYPEENNEVFTEVKGRDLVSGLPKTIKVSSREIRTALQEPVTSIVEAVRSTLERCPAVPRASSARDCREHKKDGWNSPPS